MPGLCGTGEGTHGFRYSKQGLFHLSYIPISHTFLHDQGYHATGLSWTLLPQWGVCVCVWNLESQRQCLIAFIISWILATAQKLELRIKTVRSIHTCCGVSLLGQSGVSMLGTCHTYLTSHQVDWGQRAHQRGICWPWQMTYLLLSSWAQYKEIFSCTKSAMLKVSGTQGHFVTLASHDMTRYIS